MVTKWLPDDPALLAAIGRVAVRHGQLDYCLRMTVKSLKGTSVGEALRDTERENSGKLRKQVKRIARERFGDGEVIRRLEEILNRAQRVTERRNELLHGFWCMKVDGKPGIRTERGKNPRITEFELPILVISELDDLADKLDQVADELNFARTEGFMKDALASASDTDKSHIT